MLVVCVVMQMVALMPHHHHSGNPSPCVNAAHVWNLASDACGDRCEGGHDDHDHDHDSPVAACGSFRMVILQPERERTEVSAAEMALPTGATDIFCASGCLKCMAREVADIFREISPAPEAVPLITDYITEAIPPRAPDYLA